MKLFCSISILFLISSYVLAIFIVPSEYSIKDYTLANTKIDMNQNHELKGGQPNDNFFVVNIADELLTVLIKPTKISYLYDDKTEVFLYKGNETSKKKFSDLNTNIVNGYVMDHPTCSGASGYIKNGKFYGTIDLGNKTYYVENIENFPEISSLHKNNTQFNAIIYDQDSLLEKNRYNVLRRSTRRSHHHKSLLVSEAASKSIYRKFIEDRHICSLLVLLDNSFFTVIHQEEVNAAIAQIMLTINEVNTVFRSTDFDGDGFPDNIGFIIKYFVIIENEDSPLNYLPAYSKKPVSPKFYLAHFAQYLILREVCLGVLFTAQAFQENVLGVSYSAISELDASNDIIGGICQRPFTSYMLSLNAIAVSYTSMQGVRLSQATLDTCLTHEFGHAFGCRHDRKSDPGYHEEYLMSAHTLPGTSVKNFQFSPMSKKHLILTVPRKGHCLVKSTESFCGNGIPEKGEECDCGAKYMCQLSDPCCIPNGMNEACQINRAIGFECHPSQGLCCTSKCKYQHLEKNGVDCRLISRKCPCTRENEDCGCGIGGRCLGTECQSEECARIDAEECDCPSTLEQKSCNICCLANPEGPCLPSRNLTQDKLEMGLITIKQLERFEATRILPNMTVFDQFCHGIECVTLAFKNSNYGDYCLHKGQLGICTPLGCNVKPMQRFEIEKLARNFNWMKSEVSHTLRPFSIVLRAFCLFSIKFLL